MAITSQTFSATVSEWVAKAKHRQDAVFKESTQRLISEAQRVGPSKKNPTGDGGNMPVDTGFLRKSGVASTDGPTPIDPKGVPPRTVKNENGEDVKPSYTFTMGPVAAVIATLEMGMQIWFCWTAAYARVVEYGGINRIGRGFARLAAQQWQTIVSQVAKEARDGAFDGNK